MPRSDSDPRRSLTLYTSADVIARIDAERAAVRAAMPGATMSRSAFVAQVLATHFARKDQRATKAAR